VREHIIKTDCLSNRNTSSKIDFVLQFENKIVYLEVDEDQHIMYDVSCELKRMVDVQSAHAIEGNTLPITWIRYNPDAFKIDGIPTRISSKSRQNALFTVLNEIQSDSDLPSCRVIYMFYDTLDGKPAIFDDPEYSESFKQFVTVKNESTGS